MITVKDKRTLLADVGSDTQALEGYLSTSTTALCRVSSIDPADFTPSTLSLVLKDMEELCPTRVQNAFTQAPVACHTGDVQMFNHDDGIQQRVLMGHLEMEVPSLTVDFEMCLGNTACGLLASVTARVSSAQRSLLAPQGLLSCAEEPWVLNGSTGAIRQERRQSDINTDCRSIVFSRYTSTTWRCLTQSRRTNVHQHA